MELKRLEKLKKHLLKVEEVTGLPLREKSRFPTVLFLKCPIIQFAPEGNKRTGILLHTSMEGITYSKVTFPSIFAEEDTYWWKYLTSSECREYIVAIEEWLKERKA
jgi:hypothetical protein